MNKDISYAGVGAFVILLLLVLLGVGLWLGAGLPGGPTTRYLVYPGESVTGLSPNAPVKFRGVDVGRVERIRLTENARVELLLEVASDTPVGPKTRARLTAQGLTGIAFLELEQGEKKAVVEAPADTPYPVIASAPSLRSRTERLIAHGMENLDEFNSRVSQVMSEDNIQAFSDSLNQIATVTRTLAENREQIATLLQDAERLFAQGARASEELPATLQRLQDTLAATEGAAARLETIGREGETALTRFNRQTAPDAEALIAEMRRAAAELSQLGAQLSAQPSRLLLGPPRTEPGPGETP